MLTLALVLGLCWVGLGQTATTTTLVSDANPSAYGQFVTFTATVTPVPDGGTVTFKDGGVTISTPVLVNTTNGQAQLATSSLSTGVHSITAEYSGYSGTVNFSPSTSAPLDQTVNKADTALVLATSPNPSVVGETVTLIAYVTASEPGGEPPLGTVTFTYEIGTLLGTAELVSSGPNWSRAVLTTNTLPIGDHTIAAEYLGSTDHNGSSDTEDHTVTKRETTTLVMGSDTALVVGDTVTVTVRVVDTSPGETSMPTGNVTVSVSPTGQGTPTSWSHTLVAADAGQFTFTYTPSSAEGTPHTFTATYAGDDTHEGSSGSFPQAIIKRAVEVQLSLDPTAAYIFQPVTVTVTVEDDTTAGTASVPTGTVSFDDGGKNGVFSSNTATLSGGACSVSYTPGPFDASTTTIITATYEGSSVHAAGGAAELLAVALRPTVVTVEGCTSTILVNQGCDYTVTVEEAEGLPGTATVPLGTIAYSTYLQTHGGDATVVPALGAAP
ncbi:Ig-like domain repeat protein, partial [Candidatus Bipolaricaulota bacterium]|nr:Ig-like domain repeat protein [Candidatus Bipolaricaulota bacterium]